MTTEQGCGWFLAILFVALLYRAALVLLLIALQAPTWALVLGALL